MKQIFYSNQVKKRIGKMEKQINYIQVDLKWIKNLIYLILVVTIGLNISPLSILGGTI